MLTWATPPRFWCCRGERSLSRRTTGWRATRRSASRASPPLPPPHPTPSARPLRYTHPHTPLIPSPCARPCPRPHPHPHPRAPEPRTGVSACSGAAPRSLVPSTRVEAQRGRCVASRVHGQHTAASLHLPLTCSTTNIPHGHPLSAPRRPGGISLPGRSRLRELATGRAELLLCNPAGEGVYSHLCSSQLLVRALAREELCIVSTTYTRYSIC